jgi:hypothetical protein
MILREKSITIVMKEEKISAECLLSSNSEAKRIAAIRQNP